MRGKSGWRKGTGFRTDSEGERGRGREGEAAGDRHKHTHTTPVALSRCHLSLSASRALATCDGQKCVQSTGAARGGKSERERERESKWMRRRQRVESRPSSRSQALGHTHEADRTHESSAARVLSTRALFQGHR